MFIPGRNIFALVVLGGVLLTLIVRTEFFGAAQTMGAYIQKDAPKEEALRIYVKGQGTLIGKKAGDVGLALYSVERQPYSGGELIRFGLVVVNSGKKPINLDFEVSLVNLAGETIRLDRQCQYPVTVGPGEVSPGLIDIEAPGAGGNWEVRLEGGCLPEVVRLPLQVVKVEAVGTE